MDVQMYTDKTCYLLYITASHQGSNHDLVLKTRLKSIKHENLDAKMSHNSLELLYLILRITN